MPAAKRKLLIDAQLPPALVRAIAQQGHPVEHVLDIGLLQASDDAIWQYAEASGAILITKDEDFAIRGRRFPETVPVFWQRLGNTSRKALLEQFAIVSTGHVAHCRRRDTGGNSAATATRDNQAVAAIVRSTARDASGTGAGRWVARSTNTCTKYPSAAASSSSLRNTPIS